MARITPLVDEKSLDLLQTWYKSASRQIVKDFQSVSKFDQARKAELLKQIGKSLSNLSDKTERWTNSNIEKSYKQGSNLAFDMLKALGIDNVQHAFTAIDEEAVKAIADETFLNFGDSFTGVLKSSERLFSEGVKQTIQARIAEGKILGETRKKISDGIAGQLKDGFIGMKDRSGKTWDISVYSRMLARTKIVESCNNGMTNEMLKNGYDLVIVSDHNSDHAACRKYEGKVLSITGNSEDYPSLDSAKSEGLFHPNCEHRLYPYDEDYASVSKAWSAAKENNTVDIEKVVEQTAPVEKPKNESVKSFESVVQKLGINTPKLTQFEQNFLTNHPEVELKEELGNHKTFAAYYSHLDKSISFTKRGLEVNRRGTLSHELGHAIDFNLDRDKSIIPLSMREEFLQIKTKNRIEYNSAVRQRLGWEYLSDDEISQVLKGRDIEKEDFKGVKRYHGLVGKYRKYVQSSEEVFAESYSQFINNPKMKEQLPNLYNFFDNLTK